jgi:protein-L-isoaspartate(D-aspartate) O-methyltransferase
MGAMVLKRKLLGADLPMTDSKLQRLNMVESQVRPSDVTDRRIIQAMLQVPREAFVEPALASMAYMDEPLPVVAVQAAGAGARYLLAPRTLAKLVQLCEIEPDAIVLDVGMASGYSTAILAKLAAKVVGVEMDASLAQRAAKTLRELGIANVKIVETPLGTGAAADGPFDAILLNGSVPDAPLALLEQLKDGGRLVGVVAAGGFGRAQVWRRSGRSVGSRVAFDAAAAPLPGFAREAGFVF